MASGWYPEGHQRQKIPPKLVPGISEYLLYICPQTDSKSLPVFCMQILDEWELDGSWLGQSKGLGKVLLCFSTRNGPSKWTSWVFNVYK